MTTLDKQFTTALDIIKAIAKVDSADGRDDLVARYEALCSLRVVAGMNADAVDIAILAYKEKPHEG